MKKSAEQLKVGVIGSGYLGKFHAEKYAAMPDVDLVAIVDTRRSRAQEIAAQYSTTAYFDHRDILKQVDAVSVVVPTSAHFDISKDFLEHGVDVLIEKPITTSLKEADELITCAESHELVLQVGHLERFNPAVVALGRIVKKPMFIESHRLSLYKPRATDVSVVLDLMIHDIDIIKNFVGSEINAIRAAGIPVISEYADIANARLEFESGCIANVTSSRISIKNERKIRLFQKDAYISVDFAKREITLISRGNGNSDSLIPGMQIDRMSFTQGDALNEELKSFVQSVKLRRPPVVNGRDGREALRIALEIMDQIKRTSRRLANF